MQTDEGGKAKRPDFRRGRLIAFALNAEEREQAVCAGDWAVV